LIKNTAQDFIPTATLKGIKLDFDFLCESCVIDADPEVFTKIVSNLLGNALKHSASFIRIMVRGGTTYCRIVIENDGDRIPQEYAEKVFEPFFKLKKHVEGSGLGLPLAQSLIALHNGTIRLDPYTPYNSFIIEVPLHQDDVILFLDKTDRAISQQHGDLCSLSNDKKADEREQVVILSVEDNEEFQ
ncbi:sensor histidine kinase, partial [Noviherbaspirillum sp. ST9]|uniref:sensor histidine kinase n=1 Tax=Noviherbaspirillum sp. ST9 TaxID=3401606 RepID=UPI003B588665